MREEECIKLSFPMNAAYVTSARLTASSIANRMNFEIDAIEDIKAAVSETCTYLLKTVLVNASSQFDITFYPRGKKEIEISLSAQSAMPTGNVNEMSLMMIKALMDEFEIQEGLPVTVRMVKRQKASIFD